MIVADGQSSVWRDGRLYPRDRDRRSGQRDHRVIGRELAIGIRAPTLHGRQTRSSSRNDCASKARAHTERQRTDCRTGECRDTRVGVLAVTELTKIVQPPTDNVSIRV